MVNHQNAYSLYLNQGNGSFTDIASQVIAAPFLLPYDSHGAAWADFDNDGDQDLYQLADEGGTGPIADYFFVNNNGQLDEMAVGLGLDYPTGRGRMPLWLDYDADGLLDVLHPTSRRGDGSDGPTALFHQGPAGFADMATQVGLVPNVTRISNFGMLGDLSGDGKLELLTHLSRFPDNVYDTSVVPFVDIKSSLGIPLTCCVKDAVVADLGGDLDNDLFMVRGEKDQGFVQTDSVTVEAHLQGDSNVAPFNTETGIGFQTSGDVSIDPYPFWSFGEVFVGATGLHPTAFPFVLSPADSTIWGIAAHNPGVDTGLYVGYDPGTLTWEVSRSVKDANLVIQGTFVISGVSAIGWNPATPPLDDVFLANVAGTFVDQSLGAGFTTPSSARGVVAGDFDNDMDLDLYVVSTGPTQNQPNILYENQGAGTFTIVPDAGGAAGDTLGRGDAVAVADYDRDGFLDLVVTNGVSKAPFEADGLTYLFRNAGNANHWIEIDLVGGPFSNRDAVGSHVTATVGGVVQLREQAGGIHSRGQDQRRLHFGLGVNTQVDTLRVQWPNGTIQVINNIPADQIFQVTDPTGTAAPEQAGAPAAIALMSYPNPFHPRTTLAFSLDRPQPVRLSVYDVRGRMVRRLVDGQVLAAGRNEVVWAGRDDTGRRASSGVYFVRLETDSDDRTTKIVMLRRPPAQQ